MSIGSGFSHLKELSVALDLPYGSATTYDSDHDKLCDVVEEVSKEVVMEAVEEEKRIALELGNVTNGIPYITVHCDGFWGNNPAERIITICLVVLLYWVQQQKSYLHWSVKQFLFNLQKG